MKYGRIKMNKYLETKLSLLNLALNELISLRAKYSQSSDVYYQTEYSLRWLLHAKDKLVQEINKGVTNEIQ
jgi:hypothetical protein